MAALPVLKPPIIDFSTRWDGGIADLSKNSPDVEYAFGRSIDVRSDPYRVTILGETVKESGGVVNDLIKDGDRIGTDLYEYGETGNIYKRTSLGSVTLMRSVGNSHGNGMKYYKEDDYLYYTNDKGIGRFGQVVNGTPVFVDDFLGAQGGIPLNTNALKLVAASSQYADRADTTSLSITGNFAIEAWIKPASLPTVGNLMVIASKWDIASNKRSYKFEIIAIAGVFGSGSDSARTISASVTETMIDSATTGTATTSSLSATNASFAAGQIVLIHQTQGANAGQYEQGTIQSYTTGTITLQAPLKGTYTTGAQVLVMKQYTTLTVNTGVTWTAKSWNGTTGGILAFLCSVLLTVTGNISANGFFANSNSGATGGGFRGGTGVGGTNIASFQGESELGLGTQSTANNGAGGGGGKNTNSSGGFASGGSAGHAVNGAAGVGAGHGFTVGSAGVAASDSADLTRAVFGAGAGGAGRESVDVWGGSSGGGGIYIATVDVSVTGGISANGGAANIQSSSDYAHASSAGAGGFVFLRVQTASIGSNLITASGGVSGSTGLPGGGDGRIVMNYLTSIVGTTTAPAFNAIQDNTLVTNTTYQLRIGLSSNGTNEEFLTKTSTIMVDDYFHVGVSWSAAGHVAEFFQDGASLGTTVGALTSVFDSTARAAVGADFNSTARNFYDGLVDEVRIWNIQKSADDMNIDKNAYIDASTAGLVAWYKFNGNADDATSNNNHLTAENSATYSIDVPFSGATTRQDQDQGLDTSGNTYTIPSSILESAANRQTFVPQKDPQKSLEILVAGIGTGDWTVTIHDPQNRVVAAATITNSNMHVGDVEFFFDSVWRPVRGATYHFHITTTTGDGTVTTTTISDLETVDFHTYYQFLVEDDKYHQMEQILNVLGICNERYFATYSASAGYNPHTLVFPSNWRARCVELWDGFIAIGCTQGDSITDSDQGMIFLWDGVQTTYNDYIPIAEGGINAMKNYKGKLVISAGYRGEIIVIPGGSKTTDDTLKKHVPKLNLGEYIEVMPKAMAVWQGLLRIGFSGTSNAVDVERGVYTYGQKLASSPIALTYDYPISTGTRASVDVRIGFLYPTGTKLISGWEDNLAHGTDVVDPGGTPFTTAVIEKTIKDFARVSKEKKAMVVRAEFEPLREGETVRLKYRFDRAADWTFGDIVDGVNVDSARFVLDKGNHRELEYGVELATSVTTSPALLELGVQEDLKNLEMKY